jgi:hypothetical protein
VEPQSGLVVHALEALHDGLVHFVDDIAALAGVRVDPVYPLVVHLQFEVLGPAAVAAKPAPYLGGALHHDDSIGPRPGHAPSSHPERARPRGAELQLDGYRLYDVRRSASDPGSLDAGHASLERPDRRGMRVGADNDYAVHSPRLPPGEHAVVPGRLTGVFDWTQASSGHPRSM